MGAGAAVLSLMSPVAPNPEVTANAPAGTGTSAAPDAGEGAPRSGGDADLVEAAPSAPAPGGDPDDLAPLADADTEPAALPEVGGATEGLDRPQAPDRPAGMEIAAEAPVRPATPSGAPEPGARDELSISTDPAQPPAPDLADVSPGLTQPPPEDAAPEMAALPDTAPIQPRSGGEDVAAPGAETAPAPATDPGTAPDVMTATESEPPAEAPSETDLQTPGPAAAPDPSDAPGSAAAPVAEADPQVDTDTDTDSATPAQAPATPAPRVTTLPRAETEAGDRPRIGTPVVPLTERDAAAGDPAAQDGPPPIERYAEPFENPEGKPLMSIVLIDDARSLGVEALQDFPYPLTFAVDPALPDAAERMARHRAAGFEVVALLDLPLQSAPSDAEVALAAGLAILPETVALLEGPGTGIQGNRGLSDQVTAIARDSGRGLVTQDNGLNTVQKLARNDGVPAAVVFRDFDGAGQTPTIMRRFLDQAAFRARQEGAVIMLGRIRPDTVSALVLWGLQDRAARVALAPISAVLTREDG